MKTGKALLAVFTGLAAGAALGMIFSTSAGGNKQQRKVSRKSEELVNLLGRRIDEKFGDLEAKIARGENAEHPSQLHSG